MPMIDVLNTVIRDAERDMKAAKATMDRLGASTGPNGLTPDSVKFSPEFINARSSWDIAFATLRHANGAKIKLAAKSRRDIAAA